VVGVTHLFSGLLEQCSANTMGSTDFDIRHLLIYKGQTKEKRPLGR